MGQKHFLLSFYSVGGVWRVHCCLYMRYAACGICNMVCGLCVVCIVGVARVWCVRMHITCAEEGGPGALHCWGRGLRALPSGS